MCKDTALYIGNGCRRQDCLSGHIQSLGFDMCKTSSVSAAKKKLLEKPHGLLLIQFESVGEQIFDFLSFVRHENHEAVIIVLMNEAWPDIESRLFAGGVDDVVVGKRIFPVALMSRIKRRFYNGRLLIGKTNRIMLKCGVLVDLERREVSHNGSIRRLVGVQYKLFRYFLDNPHRAISRKELVKSYIWDGTVSFPNRKEGGKAIDIAVTKLRKTIEPDPSCHQIIITIREVGWILAKDAVR